VRLSVFLCLLAGSLASADTEFFESKIRPVLAGKCFGCHSSQVKQPMAGLRLDSAEALTASKTIVAGRPDESRLFLSLTYAHTIKMPPSGRLDETVLADFRQWILDGGEFPVAASSQVGNAYWAFAPLRRGEVKLTRPPGSKELDKAMLLRRVTFDLTGLPPTPAELQAFEQDTNDGAFKRVVDRLLASPHYGERWARHWMDLVRYAETNGHEYDNDKLAPWRYRDYLIRAFNQNLPYNQMIFEHLAGDLMDKPRLSPDGATLESPLATAFYYFGEVLNSTTDPVKSRADDVDNQIDVVGKAFSGLTIACARCHDHKFDPIPTAEYYGIAGILHSTEYREVVIDSPQRKQAILDARRGGVLVPAPSKVAYRDRDLTVASFDTFGAWRTEGAAFGPGPIDGAATSLQAGAPEFTGALTSPTIQMSDQKFMHVRLSGTKVEGRVSENTPLRMTLVCAGYKARHAVAEGPTPKWLTLGLVLERNRRCYVELVDHSREGYLTVDEILFSDHAEPPPTQGGAVRQGPLISVDVPKSEYAVVAADSEGHDIKVHVRGNHLQLGAPAPRQFLSVLAGKQAPVSSGSGRKELASRMATQLAARVLVNRVWKHHFGEGLVKSLDNFGVMGERPRDPLLLDSLASEFVASDWNVKSLHQRIVLSDLYQSDAVKPRRLEAEAVRDAILAASGKLNLKLYGPSVPPFISPFQNGRGRPASGPLDGEGRRSIYIQIRRNFVPPLFTAFDYPPPASTTGVRGTSAVPSQALMLLNNEFVQQQSREFAASLLAASSALNTRVEQAYIRAFSRKPAPAELARIAEFLVAQAGRPELDAFADVVHVLLNSPEFIYVR